VGGATRPLLASVGFVVEVLLGSYGGLLGGSLILPFLGDLLGSFLAPVFGSGSFGIFLVVSCFVCWFPVEMSLLLFGCFVGASRGCRRLALLLS